MKGIVRLAVEQRRGQMYLTAYGRSTTGQLYILAQEPLGDAKAGEKMEKGKITQAVDKLMPSEA